MSRAVSPPAGAASSPPDNYWEHSATPLASLVFLLPLVIAYEAGTRFFSPGAPDGQEQQIIAFNLLRQFFGFFGATGRHLPALAVVGILLAWHIARQDAWKVRPRVLLAMVLESAALALPLLVLGIVMARYFPLAAGSAPGMTDSIVLRFGAGVYEELVFRLILFTFFSLILKDAFEMRAGSAGLLMVVLSAVLFSAYHYLSPYEVFNIRTFVFRTLAGIYFGVLFLLRGFGITAASHAAYDILIVILMAAHG